MTLRLPFDLSSPNLKRAASRRRIAWLTLAVAALTPMVRADKLVAVQALADGEYLTRRAAVSNPPELQTYVMAKGQYVAGVDPGLRKVAFSSIASALAVDLLGQRFEPAANFASADLVIAVHWGMTKDNEKAAMQLQYDPDTIRRAAEAVEEAHAAEASDISGLTRVMGASAAAEANLKAEARLANSLYAGDSGLASSNAELLGFQSAFRRDDDTGETLRAMLDEERYFVILIAYDGPALRAGAKRKVWTTRMSIRAAGVNFPTALDRMSSVAALFNGTRQQDVILMDSKNRRGGAEKPGPVIVIGDEAKPAAAKTK